MPRQPSLPETKLPQQPNVSMQLGIGSTPNMQVSQVQSTFYNLTTLNRIEVTMLVAKRIACIAGSFVWGLKCAQASRDAATTSTL